MEEKRLEFGCLRENRMQVEPAGAPGDAHRLVRNPLKIHAHLHRGKNIPQIRRHRMKAEHDVNAITVNLYLQHVNLLVVGNGGIAPVLIPLEQTLAGALKVARGQAGHHEGILSQALQHKIKISGYVTDGIGGHNGMRLEYFSEIDRKRLVPRRRGGRGGKRRE